MLVAANHAALQEAAGAKNILHVRPTGRDFILFLRRNRAGCGVVPAGYPMGLPHGLTFNIVDRQLFKRRIDPFTYYFPGLLRAFGGVRLGFAFNQNSCLPAE
jgi:hypothetical protein